MLLKFINPSKKPANTVDDDGIRSAAPGLNANITWESIRPTVKQAEILFLKPELGSFLSTVSTAYDNYPGVALSTENEAIIRRLQLALGPYIEMMYMKDNLVITGEAGPRETGDTKGTSAAPRQWAYNAKLAALEEKAYLLLDDALLFLYENASDFPAWSAGTIYQKGKGAFFLSLVSLQDYIPTKISGVAWRRLAPAFAEAEKRYLLPVLGNAFMTEIKTAMVSGTLTAAQAGAVEECRLALANWAIRHALPHFGLVLGADGMVTIQSADGINSASRSGDAINQLWISLNEMGTYYLNTLRSYLDAHRADLPTWADAFPVEKGSTPFSGLITHHRETGEQLSVLPLI